MKSAAISLFPQSINIYMPTRTSTQDEKSNFFVCYATNAVGVLILIDINKIFTIFKLSVSGANGISNSYSNEVC